MSVLPNFINDNNPFNLPKPPEYWLDRLREFDDSLVVIPSRQDCVYRLAQRRPPDPNITLANQLMKDGGDTQMLSSNGLVPVTTIRANPRWDNPLMWKELAERAPWRQGGAEAVIEKIEKAEANKEAELAAQTDAHLDYLGRDGWNYYNMKRGLRSRMWSPKIKERAAAAKSAAIKILKPS